METREITVQDAKGKPVKLNVETCPKCECKVWPSLEDHLRKVCPDMAKGIEVKCRRCKGISMVVPGNRLEMSNLASNTYMYLCSRCRSRSVKRRRAKGM